MRFPLPMVCALLVVEPALAQAPQWLPRSEQQAPIAAQIHWSRAGLQSVEVRPPTGWLNVDAPSQDLWGARLGLDLLRWGPGVIQASAGIAKGSSSPLRYENSTGAKGAVGADLHIRHQWVAGLAYFHDFGRFHPGLGLDFRRDALMVKAPPELRSHGWLNRAWWRAVAEYRFDPLGPLHPYVALEVAAPFTHFNPKGLAYIADLDNLGMHNPSSGEAAKTHGPRFQSTLALGVRFGAARPRLVATPMVALSVEQIARLETPPVLPPTISPPAPLSAPQPLNIGLPKTIVLDEAALHFADNRAEIPEEGQRLLAQWVDRITKLSPQPRLRVVGHADICGSLAYNQHLSLKRAQAVASVLRSHGLEIAEGEVSGKGFQEPIASNQTETGRARNRRVEIHLDAPAGTTLKGRVESTPMAEKPATAEKVRR